MKILTKEQIKAFVELPCCDDFNCRATCGENERRIELLAESHEELLRALNNAQWHIMNGEYHET